LGGGGLEINSHALTIHELLGKGSFGDVFGATYNHHDKEFDCAVKCFRWDPREYAVMVKEVAKEIDSLRNAHHANVVHILGMCSDPLAIDSQGAALGVCIVTTRYSCTLRQYLQSGGELEALAFRPRSRWHMKLIILADVAKGMASLHEAFPYPIIHRDLKPENIFIDLCPKGALVRAIVGDLGMAKAKTANLTTTPTHLGTLAYAAPETIEGKFGLPSDVWSFGMVVYFVVTHHVPFHTISTPGELIKAIIDERRPAYTIGPAAATASSEASSNGGSSDATSSRSSASKSETGCEEADDGDKITGGYDIARVEPDCPPRVLQLMHQCWREIGDQRPAFGQIVHELNQLCCSNVVGFFCSPAERVHALHLLPECRALQKQCGDAVEIRLMANIEELAARLEQGNTRVLHLSMHGEDGEDGEADEEQSKRGERGGDARRGVGEEEGGGGEGDERRGVGEEEEGGGECEGPGLVFTQPSTYGFSLQLVPADELAREVAKYAWRDGNDQALSGSIECVMVNACNSIGVANRLVAHGIKFVIAWQYELENTAATLFSTSFYASLQDQPTDFEFAFHKACNTLVQNGYALEDPANAAYANEHPDETAAGIPRLLMPSSRR
jgi:serine/threonine protein kinase